jgi:exonuclease SbcC
LGNRKSALEERIAACHREIERDESSLARAVEYESKAKALDVITKAFGSKGIQPILIDSIAAPQIEAIASEHISRVTGQKLMINTVKTLANGEKAECFEFLVTKNGLTWRNIDSYSPGEKAVYRLCIRLALLTWLRETQGRMQGLIVLDEAFDNVDADRKKELLSLIQSEAKDFAQVVIISHDEWICPQIPNSILIQRPM